MLATCSTLLAECESNPQPLGYDFDSRYHYTTAPTVRIILFVTETYVCEKQQGHDVVHCNNKTRIHTVQKQRFDKVRASPIRQQVVCNKMKHSTRLISFKTKKSHQSRCSQGREHRRTKARPRLWRRHICFVSFVFYWHYPVAFRPVSLN